MSSRSVGLSAAFHTAAAMLRARLLNKRMPLFISWHVTFRCNQECPYCGAWRLEYPELGTSEVLERVDRVCEMGARWITYSGGEPLVRGDIAEIISHTKAKGVRVFVNTNGILLPAKVAELRCVDRITLSLDGSAEVQDRLRGTGSFKQVMDAIEACHDNDLPVALLCLLTKYSLDSVDEVIDIASRHGSRVMFQPATQLQAYSNDANPLAAPVAEYRNIIRKLIDYKKQGAPISNSVAGLKHLAKWPSPTRIFCPAGVLTCCVEPDGRLVTCDEMQRAFLDGGDPAGPTDEHEFKNLPRPSPCSQCWCAPIVELSLAASLRLEPAWNALRMTP